MSEVTLVPPEDYPLYAFLHAQCSQNQSPSSSIQRRFHVNTTSIELLGETHRQDLLTFGCELSIFNTCHHKATEARNTRVIYLGPAHYCVVMPQRCVKTKNSLVPIPSTGQILTSCDFKRIQTEPNVPLPAPTDSSNPDAPISSSTPAGPYSPRASGQNGVTWPDPEINDWVFCEPRIPSNLGQADRTRARTSAEISDAESDASSVDDDENAVSTFLHTSVSPSSNGKTLDRNMKPVEPITLLLGAGPSDSPANAQLNAPEPALFDSSEVTTLHPLESPSSNRQTSLTEFLELNVTPMESMD